MHPSPLRQNRPIRHNLDGILIVDKPREWTSHDVVAKVRNYFRLMKLGHAGTLDPVATGVLVLLAGRATKIAARLLADDKEYRFVLRFGLVTDTQDSTGKVVSDAGDVPARSVAQIEEALASFRGAIMQTPPMFSAVKVDGVRLYKLGRKGQEVERQQRPVQIAELVLESLDWPRATLRAVCSKGTYVRTLCHDIGQQLGMGGCMESLVRLRSGQYRLEQGISMEAVLKLSPEEFKARLLPIPAQLTPHL